MAVSVYSPTDLLPAYVPVQFMALTNRYPNTIPGESGLIVLNIDNPTAAQLTTYGTLEPTDVLVQHVPITLTAGEKVRLTSTTSGYYDGNFTVLKVITTSLTVISAAYAGAVTGGFLARYYPNLRIMCQVYLNGAAYGKPHQLTVSPIGLATIDVRRMCQLQMGVTLQDLTLTALTSAVNNGVCQAYVVVWEAWDTVGANGFPIFTEDTGNTVTSPIIKTVNAAQPYYFGLTGQTYKFDDMLDDYKMGGGAVLQRFLTHMPRGIQIPINRDENARLGFLIGPSVNLLKIRLKTYDTSGTLIATNDTLLTVGTKTTNYITVGPADLDPSWITAATTTYTVQILESNLGLQYSEIITYRVEPATCDGPRIRFHWRNRMGDLDSFTFNGVFTSEGSTQSVITAMDAIYSDSISGEAGTVRHLRRARFGDSTTLHTASTDHRPQEIVQWLATELATSKEVYITYPGVTEFIPVIIEPGTIQPFSSSARPSIFTIGFRFSNETPHHIVAA